MTRLQFLVHLFLLGAVSIALYNAQWLNALATTAILLLTLAPRLLERRFAFRLAPGLEFMAVVFVFATLFLGEVRGYYLSYWWWSTLLHLFSGFLLGITGFLLVHVLNQIKRIDLHLKPGFVAFFAFLFAVGTGALWEIFEFAMDQLFGRNMQKPMLGDDSGLTDTMWDLIADTTGALVISLLGYAALKNDEKQGFLEQWIQAFVQNNPRFFPRSKRVPPAGTEAGVEESV
jgi:uncharacterized membrane protein YjdF